MSDPIVGSTEDFTIEVLTELGGKIRQSALDHITIDDEHLLQEAKELPQLLFYYQAAWCRLGLRVAQAKMRLEQARANAFIAKKAQCQRTGDKMGVEEINAHITIDPAIQTLTSDYAELDAKSDAVRGILEALRQKGHSLQMVSSIRGKEEDWLRSSFADRFTDHPQREKIVQAFNGLIDRKIL